jgi:hypothetical protein
VDPGKFGNRLPLYPFLSFFKPNLQSFLRKCLGALRWSAATHCDGSFLRGNDVTRNHSLEKNGNSGAPELPFFQEQESRRFTWMTLNQRFETDRGFKPEATS